MKKFAAVVLSACLLLSVASVASAAPAHETKHKMHAKSTHHKHKMHAKSAHKGKKLHAKSVKKGHMKMKGLTPKALPKTGFGGVSE
ncbi:hypothetical protein [Paenibacillus terrigena]|uniref:hypothetical protein n=1 Tax=Paenibacillus terrigena TaxID=369333 RepID=UPI000365699B|nr:hypothetical protein [Paenibacillus terrigena]